MSEINISERTILPVLSPEVTSFNSVAALFSILPNYNNTEEWINNNFINLWAGYQEREAVYPLRFAPVGLNRVCPYIQNNRFDKDVLDLFKNDIENFFTNSISLGYYIIAQYDEFYMPDTPHFKKEHFGHQIFIFGFDKHERVFYAGEFFGIRKYSHKKVSFSSVIQAVDHSLHHDDEFFIEILKYRDFDYKFNVDLLIKELNDYLNSTRILLNYEENILKDYEKLFMQNGEMVFGLSNYDFLIDQLNNSKDAFISVKDLHVLYDHKILMQNRIDFLIRKGILSNTTTIRSKFEMITDLCQTNRNLAIKYTISLKTSIKEKILINIQQIIKEERIAILQLLNEIEYQRNLKE